MAAGTGVLVTGGDGQVGRALREHLPEGRFPGHSELDVTDRGAVEEAVKDADIVVHLAAYTDVDGCESHPELAAAVNAGGAGNVASVAASNGVRVVYVSTDYVFDGGKPGDYVEDDPTAPLNVYGTTKLEGERYVADHGGLIVRSSWIFGQGANFVETIRRLASERSEFAVVNDQRGRPTAAADLAATLAALIEVNATGIVHAAGSGPACTWAEFAERVVDLTGSPAKIRRVTTEEYASSAPRPPAPRPRNSALSTRRLSEMWGIEMPDWRSSLASYLSVAS